MSEDRKKNERRTFIRRRVQADFDDVCQEPTICNRGMMPSTCEMCEWSADKAFEEAEAAADRFEKREGKS